MTLKGFRDSQRRHRITVLRNVVIAGLVIGALLAITSGMAGQQALALENRPRPAMDGPIQDRMVMMQNTAVWTPQGLVVLQGNRLLHYTPARFLQHTITLPVPSVSAVDPQLMPERSAATANLVQDEQTQMRSYVSAHILPAADGLIIIRGQQVIWLDSNFELAGQATLPDLPQLTLAELAAICPQALPLAQGAEADMK